MTLWKCNITEKNLLVPKCYDTYPQQWPSTTSPKKSNERDYDARLYGVQSFTLS